MAKGEKPRGRRNGGNSDHEGLTYHDREGEGDNPNRHASIIERRWLGSIPPTPELYARAVEQWHALPGAVAWSPSDLPAPSNQGNGEPEKGRP